MTNEEVGGMLPLGDRVRDRRKELRLSQGDLAERTGMTASFISQVERGVTSPSIDSLYKISRALEVPVFHFLLEPEAKCPVVRHHERIHMTWPWSGPELAFQLLTPRTSQRLEAFMTEWEPGDPGLVSGFGDTTEEFVYVLKGAMEIIVGDHVNRLKTGDSLHFNSGIRHKMRNVGKENAELIVVVYGH